MAAMRIFETPLLLIHLLVMHCAAQKTNLLSHAIIVDRVKSGIQSTSASHATDCVCAGPVMGFALKSVIANQILHALSFEFHCPAQNKIHAHAVPLWYHTVVILYIR
jgi:hypothetical protein